MAGDDLAVFVLTSGDGGKTWAQPRRLSATGSQATHVRVIANPAGDGFLAFWTRSVGAEKASLEITRIETADAKHAGKPPAGSTN